MRRLVMSSTVENAGRNCLLVTPVDNLWTTLPSLAQVIHKIDIRLTRSVRFMLSREPVCRCSSQRVVKLMGALCLLLGSSAIWVQSAQATNSIDHWKLYSHSRIINEEQYKCFSKIIYKESRWNPQAKNGSHFGLGQMRSKWYRNLDPYRQIDETLRYITKRYGTPCKAWDFHTRKGYF